MSELMFMEILQMRATKPETESFKTLMRNVDEKLESSNKYKYIPFVILSSNSQITSCYV
jgi:hypothetical protein